MKQVIIKRMALHYFKGVLNREIELGEGTNTISGPNGCGKSTIMDAFFWGLWGKNAQGQSDTKFLIKTVDPEGEEIPNVEHEVELTLDVDGKQQVFKRSLVPEYGKNGELKGNHTDYAWNDVPMKKSEYDAKVRDIISEDVFSLVTSTTAFLSLDWKKQRELLMSMGGEVADAEVANAMESDATQLLAILESGKNLEEYKRELDAKLKRVNDAMRDIPSRIDEVQRGMPDMPDMDALAAERKALDQELDAIERAEKDETNAMETTSRKRLELQKQITAIEWEMQQMVNKAEAAERNAIFAANKIYDEADAEYRQLKKDELNDREITRKEGERINRNIDFYKSKRETFEKEANELRDEYKRAVGETFKADEHLVCPLYGHTCNDGSACAQYDNNQGEAFEKWTIDHKDKIADIIKRGKEAAEAVKADAQRIDDDMKALQTLKREYKQRGEEREARAAALDAIMKQNPRRPLIAKVNADDVPGCKEMQQQIEKLRAERDAIETINATDNREVKWNLRKAMDAITVKEQAKVIIESCCKRIEELQRQYEELGSQKTDIEFERDTLVEFEICKCNLITARINDLFKIVKWQMFQRQVNGEEVPACICLCGGVRYNDANTADRLNAGIDIATALSYAYEVKAPMFIDNAECSGIIGKAPDNGGQRILLKYVPGHKEMKIEF